MPVPSGSTHAGITCGPGVGKALFRIRQEHVAKHYAPLIAKKRYGAVKLDLVLRMIALSPDHAGERKAGFVLWDWSYEDLYDLTADPPAKRSKRKRTISETRHLKRKWVIDNLGHLRDMRLVTTETRAGSRPTILVLSDDGSGKPLDDPDGRKPPDRYITIQGSLIAARVLAGWGAPELSAYLAALIAEFYDDRGGRPPPTAGTGTWWRSLAWFSSSSYQPRERVRLPFSASLLETGLGRLEAADLIKKTKLKTHPVTNRRLVRPRNRYRNKFTAYDPKVERVTRSKS